MERAARLIKNGKFSQKVFTDEDLARAVWPTAVGKSIASHTLRVKLVRETLVVEVEDNIWRKQLYCLSAQIVDRLHRVTGSNAIKDIEFRIGAPRRQPQRAVTRETVTPDHDAVPDEADTIEDPVLQKVYRLSRKKATA